LELQFHRACKPSQPLPPDTAAIEAAYIAKWRSQGATAANSELSVQDGMNCMPGDQCEGQVKRDNQQVYNLDGYEVSQKSVGGRWGSTRLEGREHGRTRLRLTLPSGCMRNAAPPVAAPSPIQPTPAAGRPGRHPQYIDRAMCKGVALKAAIPYTGVDNAACAASTSPPRKLPGIAYYTFVKKTATDLRRAVGVGGALKGGVKGNVCGCMCVFVYTECMPRHRSTHAR
jgi:hypothetical protein